MNNKTVNHMKCFLFLFGLLAFGSTALFAGEMASKTTAPDISNIGFMENPPKELKEKFPMCDVFLNVTWVNKEEMRGYSHYDIYKNGKRQEHKVFALVILDDDFPQFDLDLEHWERIGIMKKVVSLMENGEATVESGHLYIRSETNGIDFYTIKSERQDRGKTILADNRKNVCVPYPNNQRMWIVESKELHKVYGANEIANKFAEIEQWIPNLSFHDFELTIPIDLNFDGKEDYIYGNTIVYSYGNRYYETQFRSALGENDKWTFPPTQTTCELSPIGDVYLTTDGKSISLNNQCNLTELTKRGE